LTILRKSDPRPVPFFGTVVPDSVALAQEKRAALDTGADAFYVAVLPEGQYTLVADFTNAAGQNTNIQGYVAFLDHEGGGQQQMIAFNEINVTYRKSSSFSLKKAEAFILRVHNSIYAVRYMVKDRSGLV
jgi:hypothetical protein